MPVILVVDDDHNVLSAIERDLRREYGCRFRVLKANSGIAALEVLKQLKLRDEAMALLLADQRMPRMTGVEFLEQSIEIFPKAKRALITAYADSDAAICAINQAKIDYHLSKPWTPPERHLYPILNDLLEDWLASFHPSLEEVRVVGCRWSSQSHKIKDFLTRNQVSYKWLDIEVDQEARILSTYATADDTQLPLILFPDGSCLVKPTSMEIAGKIGLQTRAKRPFYDLIIVGAGPSGLAAAVYGASEGLRTVLIEREAPGGQAGTSSRIENYLGFPSGLGGADLARRAVTQCKRFGVEILSPQEVNAIRVEGSYRLVTLKDGTELSCHALLIATGVSYRRLNVPGIEALIGSGVYYGAALTEASNCQGEEVYVAGGANSAGQAAICFSQYARHVVMSVRGSSLETSMSQYLVDQIQSTENISVRLNSSIVKVSGESNLESITISDTNTGQAHTVSATRLFIFIGARPHTTWLDGSVERDEHGFILTGTDLRHQERGSQTWTLERDPLLLETSVPGIFAVGDVRYGSVKRVASAVGEGSVAVQLIHQYLSQYLRKV